MNLDDAYTEFLTNQVAPPPAPPVPEPVAPPEPAPMAAPAPAPAPGEFTSDMSISDYLGTVFRTLADIPDAAVRGAAQGLGEAAYAANLIDDDQINSYRSFFTDMDKLRDVSGVNPTVSGLVEDVGQILPAAVPAFKVFRGLGMARPAAALIAEAIGGAVGYNPDDPNLFNLIGEDNQGPLSKAMRVLATDPEDPDVINRARRGIQDAGIGGVFELALEGIKRSPDAGRATLQWFNDTARSAQQGTAFSGIPTRPDVPGGAPTVAQEPVVQPADIELPELSTFIKLPRRQNIRPTDTELGVIQTIASTPEEAQLAVDTIVRIRGNYPIGTSKDKFMPFEVTGGVFKDTKDGRVFEPNIRKQAYAFTPPSGTSRNEWTRNLSTKMVNDVAAMVKRAEAGDQAAVNILAEARWYRDMRTRMRQEFGGLGDIFADLLGTTSAQTGVQSNFENAAEIVRRFTRGEYDGEIAAWQARQAAGESMSPVVLQQMHKSGDFPLITNAAGALFNANSPASMKAIFDTFRDIKQGVSPKTPNFTGNLIGYSNRATIDVWAGRYLRNKAGLPYIPPPAEKAVGGKHGAGSTFDEPRITGEFGLGQDIFENAAKRLNSRGVVQGFDPSVGQIGADDLQAIVWFMEKEKWTKNGWTTKAGEGGSLDFEASVAGAANPKEIKRLREEARASFKEPKRRKAETDEQYQMRVQDAFSEHVARTTNAATFVDEKAAPLDRTILGVSAERPGKMPSNYEQAEMAAEFDDVLRGDDKVAAYKLTNTYGSFDAEDGVVNERSLDAEIVTRQGFDPGPLKQRLVKVGMEKDQDAVFISKVVPNPEAGQKVNPGLELYFTKKQQAAFAEELAARLRERGIDGFTFVTDARQADRINVQARAQDGADTAGITGLRVQYIPEFDDAATPQRAIEMENIFFDLAEEYSQKGDISAANVLYYETEVFKHSDPARSGWISGGQTYEQAGRNAGTARKTTAGRQQSSSDAARSNRGTEDGEVP